MATRRPNRAVQVVAGLAAFGLLAGLLVGIFVGVGGDTTTTTTPTSPVPTTTAAPLSPEQYAQRVEVARQLLGEAAGDRCALAVAYTDVQSLPPPADSAQMESLIGVTAELLRASALSAAGDQPTVSGQIAATADALETEAAAAGHDPDWLTTAGDDSALADPAFNEAFAQYQEATYEECFAEAAEGQGDNGPSGSEDPEG